MNEPALTLKGRGAHSLVAVFWLAMAAVQGHGAGPFETRERLHKPQGPLAEKALAALAEQADKLERDLLDKHMTSILEAMKEPLKITPEEMAALGAAAEGVVDEAVKSWKLCVAAGLRPILVKYGDDAGQASRISTWTAGQLVPAYLVEKWTSPEWLPEWDKAVATHLGEARATQWKTLREERRKAALPAIDRFLQTWAETGRKRLDDTLAENLRVMEKAAPLSREQTEKLSAHLRKLVDDHVAAEKEVGRDMLISMPDEPRQAFLAAKSMASRFIVPTDEELEKAWTDLAGQVAGDAALQAWKTALEQKRKELAGRHMEMLKPSRDRARTQMEEHVAQEIENLAGALSLDPERRKKVEELGKKAVADSLEVATKGWMKIAESWTEEYLNARKNVYLSANPADLPAQRAVWQDGLKTLFSEDELKQARQSATERKNRASLALARAALADADQLVALTAEQRRALEPLVAPQMMSFIRDDSVRSWRVEATQLQVAARLPEKQLHGILDEVQTAKWLRLGQAGQEQQRRAVAPALVAAPARRGRSPAELDQEVEAEVSAHMHKRSLKQRAENLELMLAQVEDAQRTLHLAPEKRERLALAAKGAVEADMIVWRQSMESWTRQQLTPDATPEAVKVMLANLETSTSFSFFMNTTSPARQKLWQDTVAAVLSKAERAAWDKVVAERKAYRVSALAGMAVFELDRRRRLGPQQCARLEKILAAVVDDYLPEIESSMSSSRAWSWHLSYYSCLMPLAGAKKADLEAVLTPAQWKLVKTEDMADAERYWDGIENRRKLRKQIQRGNAIMPAPMFFFSP